MDTPYNQHVGNYMPMQQVHGGMNYPYEAVAETIPWCAAHLKRDIHVGSQAKFAALVGSFAPRLTDMIMERIMYSSHQSRSTVSSGSRSRALFEPSYGGHNRGTHEPHLFCRRNFYVEATRRPATTMAAIGGGLFVGVAALKGNFGWNRHRPIRRASR
jgi:hypothetical protein